MTASVRDIAAVLRERLPGLPVKKMHKLLYYCQGHHLAVFGEPLFVETISAWDMGPVVGELWHSEKQGPPAPRSGELTEGPLNSVGYVLSRYGALTGRDLESLTHSESPWLRANASRRPGTSVRIEHEWLMDYFRTTGAEVEDDEEIPLDSTAVSQWLQGAGQRLKRAARPDSIEDLRARLSRGA